MPNDSGLAGKIVIVTGGSRGIGRAIVEIFAEDGAEVVFFYRGNATAAAEVVEAGKAAGRRIAAEQVDVTDAVACAAAVERVAERCGSIDVLVNNAGVIRDNLLALLEVEDVQTVLDTNVGGVFNVTRAVVPHMIARRAGKIVNVSSVSGEKGGRGQTNYAASKGAVNALTRALAVELAPRRITVNCVAPGVIETEMSAGGPRPRRRRGQGAHPAAAIRPAAGCRACRVVPRVEIRRLHHRPGAHIDGGFKME